MGTRNVYLQSMFRTKKYENSQKNSTENWHFNSREKLLYLAWACFRNESGHTSDTQTNGMAAHEHIFDNKNEISFPISRIFKMCDLGFDIGFCFI